MKTNFQDGSIVTPQFLNAINSPVWKQAPANDGEFKPPALGDMPDVQAAIAGMAQAIPDVCAVDLTACVAVGANGTDVLLSSLLNMTASKISIRPVSAYGDYRLFGALVFNGPVTGAAFWIRIPDSALQSVSWRSSFLAGVHGSAGWAFGRVLTYSQQYVRGAVVVIAQAGAFDFYTSPFSGWGDVVPLANSIVQIEMSFVL